MIGKAGGCSLMSPWRVIVSCARNPFLPSLLFLSCLSTGLISTLAAVQQEPPALRVQRRDVGPASRGRRPAGRELRPDVAHQVVGPEVRQVAAAVTSR